MTLQSINVFILKYHHIARGILIIALGLLIGLTAYYIEQHVILFGSLGFMAFAIYEGVIHMLSNPIKRDIALDLAKAETWAKSELGFDPTGVIQPTGAIQSSDAAPTPAPAAKP